MDAERHFLNKDKYDEFEFYSRTVVKYMFFTTSSDNLPNTLISFIHLDCCK